MKTFFTRLVGAFLPLIFIVIGISAQAQGKDKNEIKPDQRLYNCFTKEYVDGLISNPRLLLYYNFYLDNSWFLSESKAEKPLPGSDISTVPLADNSVGANSLSIKGEFYSEDVTKFDVKTFNPLMYDFKTDANYYTSYKLGNTGKAVIFYSHRKFAELYNAYLKSFNLE